MLGRMIRNEERYQGSGEESRSGEEGRSGQEGCSG
jgi:hypothetical protein